MSKLVHLAPEKLARRIERSGLRARPRTLVVEDCVANLPRALFAMPVFLDEQVSLQWLRELRNWNGRQRMVAVEFDVPSDEQVLYGRFGSSKKRATLSEARAAIAESPWGSEVVVTRDIRACDVTVRAVRQDIGWQQQPEESRHTNCVCVMCLPSGHPKFMRRLRAVFNGAIERLHSGGDPLTCLGELMLPLERARKKFKPHKLLSLRLHDSAMVRATLADLLQYFRRDDVVDSLTELSADSDIAVAARAIDSIVSLGMIALARELAADREEVLVGLCEILLYVDNPQVETTLRELQEHSQQVVAATARTALHEWLVE